MPGRYGRNRGFTFLELIVVLSILAVITAIIVPIYGASVSALSVRGARGDFTATIYYLQELSIQQSRELRLYVDERAGTYRAEGWISGMGDDKLFEPIVDRALAEVYPEPRIAAQHVAIGGGILQAAPQAIEEVMVQAADLGKLQGCIAECHGDLQDGETSRKVTDIREECQRGGARAGYNPA